MIYNDHQTYYDLLEIAPDASPQEIRAAYLRAKAAYKKDSVALYSLISEEETEGLLVKIEESYQVLSNPEKRREYDKHHGLLSLDDPMMAPQAQRPGQPKVVSIDRVPPMESGDDEDMLVAPSTDFTAPQRSGPVPGAPDPFSSIDPVPGPFDSPAPAARAPQAPVQSSLAWTSTVSRPAPQAQTHAPVAPAASRHSSGGGGEPAMIQEIAQEVEWRGMFLRKVREARQVSIEELCDYTKITKTYIYAIEEENFDKLPAGVYLRGFVVQMSKFLKLPSDKVAAAYMARHTQWRLEKEKRPR